MNNQLKIIKFPGNQSGSSLSSHDELDDFEELDIHAEIHSELLYKENYPALVRYCKQRAQRFPDDPYAQYELGDAYVLNGEYEEGIRFLSKHHRKHPDFWDYQHVILDALFALGKTEDDFKWTEKPLVLRMSHEIVDFCYDFLKPKRKPRSAGELYTELVFEGYLCFNEKDLLKALTQDERFVINDRGSSFVTVSVVRKKKGRP